MLVAPGVSVVIFPLCVTSFHWQKSNCHCQTMFLPITAPAWVSIVGHNNRDASPGLPSGNCWALNGHWIVLNWCLDVQNMPKQDKLCFPFFSVFIFTCLILFSNKRTWLDLHVSVPCCLAALVNSWKKSPFIDNGYWYNKRLEKTKMAKQLKKKKKKEWGMWYKYPRNKYLCFFVPAEWTRLPPLVLRRTWALEQHIMSCIRKVP